MFKSLVKIPKNILNVSSILRILDYRCSFNSFCTKICRHKLILNSDYSFLVVSKIKFLEIIKKLKQKKIPAL